MPGAHEINPKTLVVAKQSESLQQPDMVLMLPGHCRIKSKFLRESIFLLYRLQGLVGRFGICAGGWRPRNHLNLLRLNLIVPHNILLHPLRADNYGPSRTASCSIGGLAPFHIRPRKELRIMHVLQIVRIENRRYARDDEMLVGKVDDFTAQFLIEAAVAGHSRTDVACAEHPRTHAGIFLFSPGWEQREEQSAASAVAGVDGPGSPTAT